MLILDDIGYVLGIFEIASAHIFTAVVVFLVNLSRKKDSGQFIHWCNQKAPTSMLVQYDSHMLCSVSIWSYQNFVTQFKTFWRKGYPLRHCLLRSNFEGIYYPKTPTKSNKSFGPLGELIILSFPLQQGLVSAAIFTLGQLLHHFIPSAKACLACLHCWLPLKFWTRGRHWNDQPLYDEESQIHQSNWRSCWDIWLFDIIPKPREAIAICRIIPTTSSSTIWRN